MTICPCCLFGADLQGAAGLVHGIQGIVDQVEKHLLQLGMGGGYGRQFGLEPGDQFHVAVFGPLGRQGDQLFDEMTDLEIFDPRIGLAGKTEQFVGNLLAALALGADLVQGPLKFLDDPSSFL